MANIRAGEGVPDFVLMDSLTEDAMYENFKTRFAKQQIYTYIGEVLCSVNPYTQLNIYRKENIDEYRGAFMYERQPHIYALSNNAFRNMLQTHQDQCVIISGESGAGKTEASKVIMQFISATSKGSTDVERVKRQLLDSNPVLEAFGNAKTLRNNNSSRFGKYMEIQFDRAGAPRGGRISNYLLEKSRVVTRAEGERSFHIFYQLLAGASQVPEVSKLLPQEQFHYLRLSNCYTADGCNDGADFKQVRASLTSLGFEAALQTEIWRIVAAILFLGNIDFLPRGSDSCTVKDSQALSSVSNLLGCTASVLESSLTHRKIRTGAANSQNVIEVPLTPEQACFSRDALAKSLYQRLFDWLVSRINSAIDCSRANASEKELLVIGVLDIYGFEVLSYNSFEQFCINLANEKLQQLFIELTLKTEQEEYVREGIEWEPIKYFNNEVIVALIDGKQGILSYLDESCLIASTTDVDFLAKLDKNFSKHAHYQSYAASRDRTIPDAAFRLKHYAGDVVYHVNGFIDKNTDTLFGVLMDAMRTSAKGSLVHSLFPDDGPTQKRPVTSGTQFKTSLQDLVKKLLCCTPHYIRCIKPNDKKAPGLMDEALTRHQIRYLGLVENLRVRRAGFAYRQTLERFCWRYKMIDKRTWPRLPSSDARKGALVILDAIKAASQDYRIGKTKIFLKQPTSLFALEKARSEHMPRICTLMQKLYRGWRARRGFKQFKAAIRIQWFYRRHRATKWMRDLRKAHEGRLTAEHRWGRGVTWPVAPRVLQKASKLLRLVAGRWWAMHFLKSQGDALNTLMRQKVFAWNIFDNQKPWAKLRMHECDYLGLPSNPRQKTFASASSGLFKKYGDQRVLFADIVDKVNPKGKVQKRGLVVSDKTIYKLNAANYKLLKFGTPITELVSISLGHKSDTYVVLHCGSSYRDLVIDLGLTSAERFSELVAILCLQYKELTNSPLPVHFADKITFNNSKTKSSPGTQFELTFVGPDAKMKVASIFQKGKGSNAWVVKYKN